MTTTRMIEIQPLEVAEHFSHLKRAPSDEEIQDYLTGAVVDEEPSVDVRIDYNGEASFCDAVRLMMGS